MTSNRDHRRASTRRKLAEARERTEERKERQRRYFSGQASRPLAEQQEQGGKKRVQRPKGRNLADGPDPDDLDDPCLWVHDERRVDHVQEKLDLADEATVTRRLREAQVQPDPQGIHIVSHEDMPRPESLLDAQQLATFQKLIEQANQPEYQHGLQQLLWSLETHLGMGIDPIVRRVGVGPWAERYETATACLDLLQQELGALLQEITQVVPPRLVADNKEDLITIEYHYRPELILDPGYQAERARQGIVPDFEQIATAAYRYSAALLHQLVLEAVGRWYTNQDDPMGAAHLGKLGLLAPEVLDVWRENLSNSYFPMEDNLALFEGQPMRVFERDMASWIRQRGWGVY